MSAQTNHARSGVALIIALLVLAGLLLLGLPFLFSQSLGLAGTRSFAYHQSATTGRETVEQYATTAVATALSTHLQAETAAGAGKDSTPLAEDLTAIGIASNPIPPFQLALDASSLNTANTNHARVGVIITDECAKLDPNHLSVAGWDRLIKQVLGPKADWDDNMVWDSEDNNIDDADGVDDDGQPGRDGDPLKNGDNDDPDDFGQLAGALSKLRYKLPNQRIVTIEQLLLADPGHNTGIANPSDYTSNNGPTGSYGFRRRLTRAELEQLRPYLCVHLLPPGRDGLIDLANAVILNQQGNRTIFDCDVTDYTAEGTVVAWNDPAAPTATPTYGMFDTGNTIFFSGTHPYSFIQNRGFAISAPPSVNLHQSGFAMLSALKVNGLMAPTEHYGDLASTNADDPFNRLSPLTYFNAQIFEMPPIDIGSSGIIGIESAATAHDPLGRMAASRSRRSIVQAVPQEGALERRWEAQDQMYALLAQRFGSHLASWPLAVNRVLGLTPDKAIVAAPGLPIGISGSTMPSLATGWINRKNPDPNMRTPRDLDIDWRMASGAEALVNRANVADCIIDPDGGAKQFQPPYQPPVADGTFDETSMRPDGLAVNSGNKLGFTLRQEGGATHGPLRGYTNAQSINELRSRNFSFWLKPDQDNFNNPISADIIIPLFEARMPISQVGVQADGSPGHNELQNLLGLYYDSGKECLALVIAPPIIEHTNDGPKVAGVPLFRVPNDDRLTTFDLDERCLGSDAVGAGAVSALFPAQKNLGSGISGWDENNALFSSRVSRLYKPNRIITLCRVANPPNPSNPSTQRPFFRAHRWYHIQVVIGGPTPGMTRIIVDGMTGRDVTRTPPTQVVGATPSDADQLQTGDHLTLPAMPLATAIAFKATVSSGTDLLVGDITVAPVLGLNATDLFPDRGMLRIGDEYFWYDSIVSNTFKNCSRSHRQNTNVNGTPADYWPATQEHLVGDLVVPGGYRLALSGGNFYGGGCTTADILPNGDPSAASGHQYEIWTMVDDTKTPIVADPMDPSGNTMLWNTAATELPVKLGVLNQFPLHGIIRFRNQYLHYTGKGADRFTGVSAVADIGFASQPAFTLPVRSDEKWFKNSIQPIFLLSIALDPSVNAFDPGRYLPNQLAGEMMLLQLQHPTTKRVEWIGYNGLVKTAGFDYIFNGNSWGPLTRGEQRTDFVGKTLLGGTTKQLPNSFFPAQTDVMPVQTRIGAGGRQVATGDVITLLPHNTAIATPPRQLLIRYAAMDGYAAAGGVAINDTKNEYFAFAENFAAAPELIGANAANFSLLVWPGWGGADLTPQNPIAEPIGVMPRLDLFGNGYDPNAARFMIGAMDASHIDTSAMGVDAAGWNSSRLLGISATLDAVVSGNVDGLPRDTVDTSATGIIRTLRAGAVQIAGDIQIGDLVEASSNGFFTDRLGLVSIGGETYAWRQPTTAEATAAVATLATTLEVVGPNSQRMAVIIGRGLLDSDRPHSAHGLGNGPKPSAGGNRWLRGVIPAMVLPVGPVAVLNEPATDYSFFRLIRAYDATGAPDFGIDNQLDAPAALVCSPDGLTATSEIIGLTPPTSRPNPPINDSPGYWYSTAPWLRGMYNTTAGGAGNAGDLVIGWWPRYYSALPASTTATTEHFRCRQYAWAGFPIAFHQARFDLVNAATGLATAELGVQDTGIDDLFTIEARAAATGMDWKNSDINGVMQTVTIPSLAFNASGAFTGNAQFTGKAVDGAELHITWHYRSDSAHAPSSKLDAIAEAGNRTPFLGAVKLRCLAPCAVLGVEESK